MDDGSLQTRQRGSTLIACVLTALSEPQRRRRAALAVALQVGTCDVVERPSGYAFHLDPGSVVAQRVEELIALEKLCCPFLTFATGVDAATGRVVLEVSGGKGVKAFLAARFGLGG